MKEGQEKGKKYMVAILCLVNGIFFCGCSEQNSSSTKISQKFFSMSLNQQSEYQPLLNGQPDTCGMRSGRVYLKPGEECGTHSTKANEEMLTFLEGKGVALIGEEKAANEVEKGNIVYIPPYTVHNIKNIGTEPLVYIYCVAPVK
jgi:mannose-6-phosphate isomerase-like protein (cupin superfamily)